MPVCQFQHVPARVMAPRPSFEHTKWPTAFGGRAPCYNLPAIVLAGVAELADARDLKSRGPWPCGFESHRRHHTRKLEKSTWRRVKKAAKTAATFSRMTIAEIPSRSTLAGPWSIATATKYCRPGGASITCAASHIMGQAEFDEKALKLVLSV